MNQPDPSPTRENSEPDDRYAWPMRLLTLLAVVIILYFGAEVLIPTALALLLTFLFNPLVVWMMRRAHMPRVAAVVLTITMAGGVCAILGALVTYQAIDLIDQIPDYRDNLRAKAQSLKATFGGSRLKRVAEVVEEVEQELSATQPSTSPASAPASVPPGTHRQTESGLPAPDVPTPVRIVGDEPGPGAAMSALVSPFVNPVAQGAIVLLLLVFLLLYSDDVRERIIWIAGKSKISLTTAALDEIGSRMSAYLRMQLIINCIHGAMVTAALFLVGVPNALLWGLFAAAFRFIPYLGPWLGSLLPILLAVAVFPGWTWPLVVVGLFILIELISNMILEPWLYSDSSGVSTLGVVLAAVFWGWLWGAVGLILAVPLTVCLVVIGKFVPQLSFINHLLGRESVMPTSGRLYQRLLVGDEVTAREIIEQELETRPFVDMCDEVVLPVLQELKRDAAAGINTARQTRTALRILDMAVVPVEETPAASLPSAGGVEPFYAPLLCAATQNEIDDLAATLLCRAAVAAGIPSQMTGSRRLASEVLEQVRSLQPASAVIVQVAPISRVHTRHLIKTLSRNDAAPDMTLIELSIETEQAQVATPTNAAVAAQTPSAKSTAPTPEEKTDPNAPRRERLIGPTLRRISELHQVKRAAPSSEIDVRQPA